MPDKPKNKPPINFNPSQLVGDFNVAKDNYDIPRITPQETRTLGAPFAELIGHQQMMNQPNLYYPRGGGSMDVEKEAHQQRVKRNAAVDNTQIPMRRPE
jgi:hypothetical protein